MTTVPLVSLTYMNATAATALVALLDTSARGWVSALVAVAGVLAVKVSAR